MRKLSYRGAIIHRSPIVPRSSNFGFYLCSLGQQVVDQVSQCRSLPQFKDRPEANLATGSCVIAKFKESLPIELSDLAKSWVSLSNKTGSAKCTADRIFDHVFIDQS